MNIYLRKDVEPFAIQTPWQIPWSYKEDFKNELPYMETQGIIVPAEDNLSAWCNPLVTLPKSDGGVYIAMDPSMLNNQVFHPNHPSPTLFKKCHIM